MQANDIPPDESPVGVLSAQLEQLRQVVARQFTLTRELRARVAQQRAPLAVVGMGLRLPGGVRTPEQYWQLLLGDADVVSEIPAGRAELRSVYHPQRGKPGYSYVDRGSFLDGVDQFDAGFFGISRREAEVLDPQQRLLLETAYEAMERAGIPVRRQDRLSVGVFVGIMASEYGERLAARADKTAIDPYYGTGGGHCFAAGRISYTMGLSGPALSVDTACSSSLVALHLAARSLRAGECRYALVGGSNLMFSGDLMVSLSQSSALAPDGRCKTFTADANGYGRGEGVGMLALMRLADAEAAGHPILAVVRGTASNHDGAAAGLTVPSGPAQRELIRIALADAAITPDQVGWVEAHGTGTSLGDPIEVGALDVLAGPAVKARKAPLYIGSVKSRIGHLEAAAGVAGLMKVILMLQHGVMPAAVAANATLNPLIGWSAINVNVPMVNQTWPVEYTERVAGVSAFGLSGTNAHAVLSAHQRAVDTEGTPAPGPELITLSAKDEAGLAELVIDVGALLGAVEPAELARIAHTLRAGRAHLPCRLAVVGDNAAGLSAQLVTAEVAGVGTRKAGPAPRISLRLGSAETAPRLATGLAALAAQFPILALTEHDQLDTLLLRLGVRVGRGRQGSAPAELEWEGVSHPIVDGAESPQLLLTALAALFVRGADLDLAALRTNGTRFTDRLPTYPFRADRHWIAETPRLSEPTPPQSLLPTIPAAGGITEFLLEELATVLHGDDPIDAHSNFLELGGDSFVAMLLGRSFEQQFGVSVPIESFDGELTVAELATRLELLLTEAA